MADSSGTTLMDLITSDPAPPAVAAAPPPPSASPAAAFPPPYTGSGKPLQADRKAKKGTLMQIQSDTISAAKAALNPVRTNIMPQRQKKKPVSYGQLARSIHELASTSDQKSSQKQLVHHVFPKLAVYNSVDPSLAPSLLMLGQQCEDKTVLRYVYYYLARILSDTGSQGLSPGGGIPTPNWDALADIDAVGGVTRADVVPRIVDRLSTEVTNEDVEFHARRIQALKALTYAPSSNSEILSRLYEIVFGLLDKVADEPQKRKKGIFGTKGGDKEMIFLFWESAIHLRVLERVLCLKVLEATGRRKLHSVVLFSQSLAYLVRVLVKFDDVDSLWDKFIIRSNLQYAALSALRRLPLDPGNPAFLHRAVQGYFRSGDSG
ncbi:hypothetical protein RHMOL_Rhmol01G0101900 [Rhododendron molle]|uniref:Uncharacterized protein n=1 Tax=Rhododendron molle TaxID=49168 RepID=A0ACC0Q1B1_RHOML|nr:hypothetical protein RHMOL_Rhmol01G0101900 [Rhododendron molle]